MPNDDDALPTGKAETAEQRRYDKLMAKLERLEKKIEYATMKIRGRDEAGAAAHVIPAHMVWLHQPFFVNAKVRVTAAGIPDIRCFFLQSCLRSVENVAGDVAECGVREGKSALFMLEAVGAVGAQRDFFLFDSFEGLSDPAPEFDTLPTAFDAKTGLRIFAGDVEQVARNFHGRANVRLMKGWIPERFQEVADRRFALVHVDVDLYQPTRDALEFFYPRLQPHGLLICDDYGSGAYPGARKAMDDFFAEKPETPVELPQGQAFIVKR